MADGFCDANNNDMNCDFDGGDCCSDTCVGVDEDDSGSCSFFDCRAPNRLPDWPFLTINDDICYPFTLQKAFLEVLDSKNLTSSFDDLPSLSCPDCDSYNRSERSYLSIPFVVNTEDFREFFTTLTSIDYDNVTVSPNGTIDHRTKKKTVTTRKKNNPMFPFLAGNETRSRSFLDKNFIISGVMITQTRVSFRGCPIERQLLKEFYGAQCMNDEPLTGADPFGVDVTFVSTSSLFRSSNEVSSHYEENELNTQGIPYAFFFDGGCIDCKSEVRDFPIVFDVNLNISRMNTVITLMREGNYIDSRTATVKVQVPMVSFELGRFILVTVSFKNSKSGNWNMDFSIDVLPEYLNNWERTSSLDMWQCTVEIMFLISWILLVSIELMEIRRSVTRTGFPFVYIFDVGNTLDWLNYGLQLAGLFAWISYVTKTSSLEVKMHYSVYRDYFATARLLQATEDMARFQDLLDSFSSLVQLRSTYSTILCSSLLVTCLQTLKNLDFHPKLGIVTKTIRGAASDLIFFAVLFLIVQTIYGFLGVLLFGPFDAQFSTFGAAFSTNQYLLLGVADPI